MFGLKDSVWTVWAIVLVAVLFAVLPVLRLVCNG